MINTLITHNGDMETKTLDYEIDGHKYHSVSTYRTGHEHKAPYSCHILYDNGNASDCFLSENGLYVKSVTENGKRRVTLIERLGNILYKEVHGKPEVPDLSKININIEMLKFIEDLPEELKICCKKSIGHLIEIAQKILK